MESMLVWVAPAGQRFSVALAARSNGGRLLNEVRRLAEEQAWRMAARHPLGQGLEDGPPALGPALEARAKLVSQKAWDEVKALDAIVCGGVWPASHSLLCHRCGAPDSPRHRYYACPKLADSQLPAVEGTAHIAQGVHSRYTD